MSHNAFFSSCSEKNIFFDIDIVSGKKQIKCGLAWPVLLSTCTRFITVVKKVWIYDTQSSEYTTNFDHCDDEYHGQ